LLNRATLIGNLGKDPDARKSDAGDTVTTFKLATTVRVGTRDQTDWHQIVTFGRLAESCAKVLKKSRLVYVEGRIQYRKYERDGEEKWKTEIIADRVQFLTREGNEEFGNNRSF
jgi:single-strand DNA-binding protein